MLKFYPLEHAWCVLMGWQWQTSIQQEGLLKVSVVLCDPHVFSLHEHICSCKSGKMSRTLEVSWQFLRNPHGQLTLRGCPVFAASEEAESVFPWSVRHGTCALFFLEVEERGFGDMTSISRVPLNGIMLCLRVKGGVAVPCFSKSDLTWTNRVTMSFWASLQLFLNGSCTLGSCWTAGSCSLMEAHVQWGFRDRSSTLCFSLNREVPVQQCGCSTEVQLQLLIQYLHSQVACG